MIPWKTLAALILLTRKQVTKGLDVASVTLFSNSTGEAVSSFAGCIFTPNADKGWFSTVRYKEYNAYRYVCTGAYICVPDFSSPAN